MFCQVHTPDIFGMNGDVTSPENPTFGGAGHFSCATVATTNIFGLIHGHSTLNMPRVKMMMNEAMNVVV